MILAWVSPFKTSQVKYLFSRYLVVFLFIFVMLFISISLKQNIILYKYMYYSLSVYKVCAEYAYIHSYVVL